MRLVVIRHAESEYAVNNIVGGLLGCHGLTPRGREQAEWWAERLRRTGELADCAALMTSPWRRARQTAEILFPSLPVTAVSEEPNLCELLPGQADGLTWDAYQAQYSLFDLVAEPRRPFSPGGESWQLFPNLWPSCAAWFRPLPAAMFRPIRGKSQWPGDNKARPDPPRPNHWWRRPAS
jgi:broad specificity phosphatase PhoE